MNWTADKVMAIILIVGCLALIFTGIDTEVKSILGMAAVWLFGTSYGEFRARRKK